MALADFDDDGLLDAVVVTQDPEESHRIYFAFGDEEPLEPISFGEGSGHRTLVAAADFNEDGYPDVLIANGDGFLLYLYDEGEMILADECGCDCYGAPIQIRVGNLMNSGALDVIVAYENAVVCIPGVGGDFSCDSYLIDEYEEGVIGIELMRMDEEHAPYEHVLILTNDQFVIYEAGEEEATLVDSCGCHEFSEPPTAFRRADPQSEALRLVFAGASKLAMLTWDEGTWIAEDEGDLPWPRTVYQIEPVRLDPQDDNPAYIIRAAGITYVMQHTQNGFEVCEIVGYPDGLADVVVRIGDANDSGYADLVLARSGGYHEIFVNGARIEATINDGDDVEQLVDGQAYAEFEVALDAPPVSLVLVAVETDGEDEYEPQGFGQQSFSQGPWRHVPTSQVLTFGIGVTTQTFFVPLTPHFPGPASGQMYAQLLQPTTIGATLGSQSTAQTIIHPAQNPAWDWKLGSEVNAIVQDPVTGNTYFGGEFEGMKWEINNGLAIANASGRQRVRSRPITFTSTFSAIYCVATDSLNRVYIGGEFSFEVGGVTLTNAARMLSNGFWDPTFHPNPDGPVHAIEFYEMPAALQGPLVPTWVFLGGSFSNLTHPTEDGIPVGNFAMYPASGDPFPTPNPLRGGITRIGVTSGPSVTDTAVVRSIDVPWDPVQGSGTVLAIGGSRMFELRVRNSLNNEEVAQIANIGLVSLEPTTTNPLWPSVADIVAPRALWDENDDTPSNSAVVKSVAIANQSLFGDATGGTAVAVAFGGEFNFVRYHAGEAGDATLESRHVGISTVEGHMPSDDPGDLPTDTTLVWSIALDQNDRIWVARDVANPATDSPIWVYNLDVQGIVATLDHEPDFDDFAPDGAVYDLAFNPSDNAVVAVGEFTSRAAAHELVDTSQVERFTLPAQNITAYSTIDGPPGEAFNFGNHLPNFRAGANPKLSHVAPFASGQHGYVFYGVHATEVIAERANLAAIDIDNKLLEWGPRTGGPVRALAIADGHVYVAGDMQVHGLSDDANSAFISAVPTDGIATAPVDWAARVQFGSGTPVINALAVSTDFLIIGGEFDAVGNSSGFNSVAAVDLYVQGTVEGDQSPINWVPAVYHYTGTPTIKDIHVDGSDVYLAGRLTGIDPLDTNHHVNGLVLLENPPGSATGSIDIDGQFDLNFIPATWVNAVARNSAGDFCLAGMIEVGGVIRTAVCYSGSSVAFTVRGSPLNEGLAIAVDLTNDRVFVAGKFHFIEDGTPPYPQRKGVAAFSSSGTLLNWSPDVLEGQPGDEEVRALLMDTGRVNSVVSPYGVVWVGGEYSGGTALSWLSGVGKDLGMFALPGP